jgi:cellulose biosynthesis protein BcsQ
MFDPRTSLAKNAVDMVRSDSTLGVKLFETMITTNTKLAEAPAFHTPIYGYQPQSQGSSRAIEQFDSLAAEVLKRLDMPLQKQGDARKLKVAK